MSNHTFDEVFHKQLAQNQMLSFALSNKSVLIQTDLIDSECILYIRISATAWLTIDENIKCVPSV